MTVQAKDEIRIAIEQSSLELKPQEYMSKAPECHLKL